MKTNMKRLLSLILCMATLCTTAVFCASAEDAALAAIPADPTVAVKRAEGEIVYELEFRFTAGEDGAALGFTSFDADKIIPIRIDENVLGELTTITAKPTAYDASNGVLTASVLNWKGDAGMNLHRLECRFDLSVFKENSVRELFNMDKAEYDALIDEGEKKILDAYNHSFGYTYSVDLPENLLTGEGVGSAAYSFTTDRIEGQVVRTEIVEAPKIMISLVKLMARMTMQEWFGQKLSKKIVTKFFDRFAEDDSDRTAILATLPFLPMILPAILKFFHAWSNSIVALSGINSTRFSALGKAVRILRG